MLPLGVARGFLGLPLFAADFFAQSDATSVVWVTAFLPPWALPGVE